jgi:cytoskeletal protein CcmA (bactofilin family)
MWDKNEASAGVPPGTVPAQAPWQGRSASSDPTSGADRSGKTVAQIGRSLKLKGDISGGEDLFIDGEVDGKIELDGNSLTVGPNGSVQGEVRAHSVNILGKMQGQVRASDCVELRKTGSFEGDVVAARIVIEEGAVFRGSIDIVKPGQEQAIPAAGKKKEAAAESAPSAKAAGKSGAA